MKIAKMVLQNYSTLVPPSLPVLAAHGDAPGVREPADEHDGGDGGRHHQRRALPGQVGDARLHRATGTRGDRG